jgi:ABC-type multidrug transport system fused ATPase/permease subunit
MNLFILVSFLVICSAKKFQWSFVPQEINYISVTLNWILVIPSFIEFLLFYYVYFSQSMSSVERMIFNVDKETFEGPFELNPKPSFNDESGIQIQNVYSRYRDNLPFVLKGISLKIEKGKKVAFVGRTGSGKSSLMLALTRILNVQNSKNYPKIQKYQKLNDDNME